MPDANKALKVNVIKDVLMGIQVLPAECREFAKEEVTVGIVAKDVTLAAAPRARLGARGLQGSERSPKAVPRSLGDPDATAVEAMRRAGFNLPPIVLQEIARDPAGVWLAAPLLVPMGMLPPLPHGA